MKATETLWINKHVDDPTAILVPAGHETAMFPLIEAGDELPDALAVRFGLMEAPEPTHYEETIVAASPDLVVTSVVPQWSNDMPAPPTDGNEDE